MLHFPEEFPVDAISVLAPIVRSGGTVADKVAAGEAALTLQAYGMGQWLGYDHGPHVVGAPGPGKLDDVAPADALAQLEAHAGTGDPSGPHVVGKIDPRTLGALALRIARFVIPLILGV